MSTDADLLARLERLEAEAAARDSSLGGVPVPSSHEALSDQIAEANERSRQARIRAQAARDAREEAWRARHARDHARTEKRLARIADELLEHTARRTQLIRELDDEHARLVSERATLQKSLVPPADL
ncbi:hypothetical protein NBH00_12770 [Paraconexibacter antarcticus]|uniref:Uncharacterized protein n=1 Tax=Paraconexibacter antarcticus TaxID=2949664 RepID=A0ABY5DKJ7_9ACTN|nr:hypothetical protein [Paraconexibacter antarcticus]UTI62241.1 hypothetical protein NBH00_12770 [Paraconexibacter antarcticus]